MVPHDNIIFVCLKCEAMIQVSDMVISRELMGGNLFEELLTHWKKQSRKNENE